MDFRYPEIFVALSEFTRKQVESKLKAFCDQRIPAALRNEIRLGWKFRGNAVTLFESRPTFPPTEKWVDIPVAQFRFDPKTTEWSLYCADRNGRWHFYSESATSRDLDAVIHALDTDRTGIFWG